MHVLLCFWNLFYYFSKIQLISFSLHFQLFLHFILVFLLILHAFSFEVNAVIYLYAGYELHIHLMICKNFQLLVYHDEILHLQDEKNVNLLQMIYNLKIHFDEHELISDDDLFALSLIKAFIHVLLSLLILFILQLPGYS